MKPPSILLPKIIVLVVEYDASGGYRLEVADGEGRADEKREERPDIPSTDKHLVAVAICGSGVIVKPSDSDTARRVESDAATFVSSRANGFTSFFRRERTAEAAADLKARGIVPVEWFCVADAADLPRVVDLHVERIRSSIRFGTLFRPSEKSSAILQAAVRRTYIPVLGFFMTVLAANALLSPKLNAEHERLRTATEARERDDRLHSDADARERELIRSFASRRSVTYAVLCDRMAASVPADVRLLGMEIDPPSKRFEAGKPLSRRENTAIIRGEAPSSESVSELVANLAANGFGGSVEIASVERVRDARKLNFKIEIRL